MYYHYVMYSTAPTYQKHLVSSGRLSLLQSEESEDISLLEIRFGQSIIVFILMCIIVLACRNQSHRIGLAMVVVFLMGK